jgi:hypothetical protein
MWIKSHLESDQGPILKQEHAADVTSHFVSQIAGLEALRSERHGVESSRDPQIGGTVSAHAVDLGRSRGNFRYP